MTKGWTPLFIAAKKRDTLLLLRSSLQLAPTMTFQRQQVGQIRFSLLQKMGTFMS
jgi:hypothetical protein